MIYIEANSGAVKRVGRCDAYATEFDLEAEEYVPLPKVCLCEGRGRGWGRLNKPRPRSRAASPHIAVVWSYPFFVFGRLQPCLFCRWDGVRVRVEQYLQDHRQKGPSTDWVGAQSSSVLDRQMGDNVLWPICV